MTNFRQSCLSESAIAQEFTYQLVDMCCGDQYSVDNWAQKHRGAGPPVSWCIISWCRTHPPTLCLYVDSTTCILLCGVDQQSSMVTFTRNQPDERLDTHYPLPSVCRSRSDRPPWISHLSHSTHLWLFTSIKFASAVLRFKNRQKVAIKNKNRPCFIFLLKSWFLFVHLVWMVVLVEIWKALTRQSCSLGKSSSERSQLHCKYLDRKICFHLL